MSSFESGNRRRKELIKLLQRTGDDEEERQGGQNNEKGKEDARGRRSSDGKEGEETAERLRWMKEALRGKQPVSTAGVEMEAQRKSETHKLGDGKNVRKGKNSRGEGVVWM